MRRLIFLLFLLITCCSSPVLENEGTIIEIIQGEKACYIKVRYKVITGGISTHDGVNYVGNCSNYKVGDKYPKIK